MANSRIQTTGKRWRSQAWSVCICCLFVFMLVGCGSKQNDSPSELSIDSRLTSGVTTPASENVVGPEHTGMQKAGFYTFAKYNKEASPERMLEQSLERAQGEDKVVIVQAGGDWCIWCERISEFMQNEPEVKRLLDESYLVMKVHFPSDAADEFIADLPKPEAYPHFYLFDKTGKFIHSQDTEELEEGEGYDSKKFLKFLNEFAS